MTKISFKSKLFLPEDIGKVGSLVLLALPKPASAKLPSRGMVMVEGSINGSHFQAPLEPDGKGGHLLIVDTSMQKVAKLKVGDSAAIEMAVSQEWPEPKVPADIKKSLTDDKKAYEVWNDITPMARWDWIRWIGSTKQPETRKRRISNARSMLKSGKRRPCCFNRTACTIL